MRICYFGTYEKDYPRNRNIIEGLRKNGVKVIECHRPLWELTRDKTGKYLKNINLICLSIKILVAYSCLILDFLKIKDIDLVMVGYIGQIDIFLAKILTFFKKIPVVFNPNISLYETLIEDRNIVKPGSIKAKILWCMDRYSCRIADMTILDTEEHINYFKRVFEVEINNFIKVFVGAEEEIFYPRHLSKRNSEIETFDVLFFGKFIPLHGLGVILNAAKLLEDEYVNFTIIGSGQLSKHISALNVKLRLKNVEFIDWIPHRKLPDYISKADACLGIFGTTPKAKRVIPNKAFEALAMGKPLITGDSPAIREVLNDRKNAVLCEMGNPQSLAGSILSLKNNVEFKTKIEKNGYRKFNENFTSEVLGKDLKIKLEKLVGDN